MSSISPVNDNRVSGGSGSRLDRWFRGQVCRRIDRLQTGTLVIIDADGRQQFGTGQSPRAEIVVSDQRFWRFVATGGGVGAGEAFMAGWWSADELTTALRVLAANRSALEAIDGGGARIMGRLLAVWHAFNRNTLKGSQRNISAHYDLGNAFFRTWLDEQMQYSSALYQHPDETLEQAQHNKLDRLCQKLDLQPGMHLLEIGTGWGGLAIHAARHYGCRVTTTTISRRQFDYAADRIKDEGLNDLVELRLDDYRHLTGRYDRVVSVEMVEAVGHQYLDTYLGKIDALLKPGGLAMVQAITIEDHRYRRALKNVDFIKRYVFPGSFIPSVSAIAASMGRSTRLGLIELFDMGSSYCRTLADWRERFLAAWPEIRAMGFDETFRRRWLFYLAYCEAGFAERAISNVQLLFAGPDYRNSDHRDFDQRNRGKSLDNASHRLQGEP